MRYNGVLYAISLIVLVIANLQARAQDAEFRVSYHLGAGKYMMEELKALNEERLEEIDVRARILQNYPVYFTHTLAFSQKFAENHYLGFCLEHQSTGSRISYKDYSGELILDTNLTANSLGLFYQGFITKRKGTDLSWGSYLYYNLTLLQIDNFLRVNSTIHTEKINFKSQGISIQPFISASKQIKSFALGTELSAYLNGMAKDFYLEQNKDATLVNNDGSRISPDWTGLRFKASITYLFIK